MLRRKKKAHRKDIKRKNGIYPSIDVLIFRRRLHDRSRDTRIESVHENDEKKNEIKRDTLNERIDFTDAPYRRHPNPIDKGRATEPRPR